MNDEIGTPQGPQFAADRKVLLDQGRPDLRRAPADHQRARGSRSYRQLPAKDGGSPQQPDALSCWRDDPHDAAIDPDDVWFDCEVPLSADMVAIIGNKGSGKSALADMLALAGNTHCDPRHFSFLTKERFCERNGRIAKHFEVDTYWLDGIDNHEGAARRNRS